MHNVRLLKLALMIAALIALAFAVCKEPNNVDEHEPTSENTTKTQANHCVVQADKLRDALTEVGSDFDKVAARFKGQAEHEQLARLRTRFVGLLSIPITQRSACKTESPFSEHHQHCAERALRSIQSLKTLLGHDIRALERLNWTVDAKLLSIEDALMCEPPGSVRLGEVAITLRGAKRVAGVHLETNDPVNSVAIRLEADLLCQRQSSPGSFEPLSDCGLGARLREDDRFQIRFQLDRPGVVYLMLHNGSGQFQMLFPGKGVGNTLAAKTSYTLPGEDKWWSLDEHGGVLEHIQLVAATHNIMELEALRGADYPPASGGGPPVVARRTRAKLEMVVARGIKTESSGLVMLKPDGAQLKAERIFSEGPGVVALEFELDHAR